MPVVLSVLALLLGAVPDRKQKGPARPVNSADAAVVKELGRGLQASPAAAAAFLQQQARLTGEKWQLVVCVWGGAGDY
jgi:hypothetical protein